MTLSCFGGSPTLQNLITTSAAWKLLSKTFALSKMIFSGQNLRVRRWKSSKIWEILLDHLGDDKEISTGLYTIIYVICLHAYRKLACVLYTCNPLQIPSRRTGGNMNSWVCFGSRLPERLGIVTPKIVKHLWHFVCRVWWGSKGRIESSLVNHWQILANMHIRYIYSRTPSFLGLFFSRRLLYACPMLKFQHWKTFLITTESWLKARLHDYEQTALTHFVQSCGKIDCHRSNEAICMYIMYIYI